ncbi:hypothetical protein ABZ557_31780 [Streptomyces sp. NPDC019645]|uniref:hypothetical protein n=1 Tax=Streptomyces sp. NPDC019645 TaxID=3154786 RepID=UPI0033F6EE99
MEGSAPLGQRPPGRLRDAGDRERDLVRDYEHHPASSASRVYWAMTQVMARRLTGENTPTWREPQTVSA